MLKVMSVVKILPRLAQINSISSTQHLQSYIETQGTFETPIRTLSQLLCIGLEDDRSLAFGTQDEQHTLLHKVLAASDLEAEEEMVPGERVATFSQSKTKSKSSMVSLSGADDAVFMEYKAGRDRKHDLFKKFRG